MTNKEKLDKLLNMQCSLGLNPPSCFDQSSLYKELYNSLVKEIEQLEITNRNNENVIADSVKLLNRNLKLQARLETLKQTNNALVYELEKEDLEYQKIKNLYFDSMCKNEKLKKAIENEIELLIERRFNAYACDDYETHNVLNTIIEELREVMNNEI